MKCDGWRRRGGAFTLGPVVWEQCDRKPIARLKIRQDGKEEYFLACAVCWDECIKTGIQILSSAPIMEEECSKQ